MKFMKFIWQISILAGMEMLMGRKDKPDNYMAGYLSGRIREEDERWIRGGLTR